MGSPSKRRTGQELYNGFELNLYGFLPAHLIAKDQEQASPGLADYWDPANMRLDTVGVSGGTFYTVLLSDPPVKGSLAVFSGSQTTADDGLGTLRTQAGDALGTVNYTTGRITITFTSATTYTVYATYATVTDEINASYWDQSGAIWDRISDQPVIQKTFWGIEIESTETLNAVDNYDKLAYVDVMEEEYIPYGFSNYGFEDQITDIGADLARVWLRNLREQWRGKCSYRLWYRILQNLGFTVEIYPLYKSHPLDNYGENTGEIYSREITDITLAQQVAYESALAAAGNDPTSVAAPATGTSVTITAGIGQYSYAMNIQVPVISFPPDWSTLTFSLYTLSGGIDPEVFTLDSATGDITGSYGATGVVDLTAGSGIVNFGRILGTEYYFQADYTSLVAPYQAARVDVEVEIDETVEYKSGDRAIEAVTRVLETMRPIHVLIRFIIPILKEDEDFVVDEAGCCGPNQGDMYEYEYAYTTGSESPASGSGLTVYGGSLDSGLIRRGTFSITDVGSGQTITDDSLGFMTGDGTGEIDYNLGIYYVQFTAVTVGTPSITYEYAIPTSASNPTTVRYMGDALLIGEPTFDRSDVVNTVTYSDVNVDSDYENIYTDLVGTTAHVTNPVVVPGQLVYSGQEAYPVVRGTLVVSDPAGTGQSLTDNEEGYLTGDGVGQVNYDTGWWVVTFETAPTGATVTVASTEMSSPQFQGTLQTNLVSGEVHIHDYATSQHVYDDGAGSLVGDIGVGANTINYATGVYDVTFLSDVQYPIASYAYANVAAHTVGQEDMYKVLEDMARVEADYTDLSTLSVGESESIGVAGSASYTGTLSSTDLTPGSTDFVEDPGAAQSLVDTTPEGAMSGSGTGSIAYLTGVLSVVFTAATKATPSITYKYLDASGFENKATVTPWVLGSTTYSTTLTGSQIVPGSVVITSGSQTISDTGIVQLFGSGSGTLDYTTGDYVLAFSAVTVDAVIATYDTRVLVTY